ncbi:MAG: IclR family transcriptional regulator [Firmicutes bacterium]|jgi:DNA-binding IclR family transcriptional regulator|nr:IclR family transcriptional regulator [Bacillota bacterium]
MVKSVSRALELLQLIGNGNKKYTLAEISKMSSLPPSTVHRLLLTLKEHGFVNQDEISTLYYLGPSLVSLGIKASNFIDLRKAALPVMENMSKITGEDSYLVISDHDKGIFIEHVNGHHPLKIIDSLGTQVPLHCGAIRKVLLAHKDRQFIEDYMNRHLEKYTEFTITNPSVLLEDLESIKRNNYAFSISEYIQDAFGIGCPIRDSFGKVIASIGIIGPASRLDENNKDTLISIVRESADKLSKELGYDV